MQAHGVSCDVVLGGLVTGAQVKRVVLLIDS